MTEIEQNLQYDKSITRFVTPEMYGAVGNGVADDTEAVTAAFLSGYPVTGEGTYNINITSGEFPNLRIIGGKYTGTLNCNATNLVICDSEIDGAFHITLTSTNKTFINRNKIRCSTGFIFASEISGFDLIEICDNIITDFTHYIFYHAYEQQEKFCGDLMVVKHNVVRGHTMTERVNQNSYYVFVLSECKHIVFSENDCRGWSSDGAQVVSHDLCGEAKIVDYSNNYLEDVYSLDANADSRCLIRAKKGTEGTEKGIRRYSNSTYKLTSNADIGYYITRSQSDNIFIVDNCYFDIYKYLGSYTFTSGSELNIYNSKLIARNVLGAVFFNPVLRMANTEIIFESAESQFNFIRHGDTIIKDCIFTDLSGKGRFSTTSYNGTTIIFDCIINGFSTFGTGVDVIKNSLFNQRLIH